MSAIRVLARRSIAGEIDHLAIDELGLRAVGHARTLHRGDLGGQRLELDARAIGHRDRTFDRVLELADVARPRILHQRRQGLGGEPLRAIAPRCCVPLEQKRRERGDVLATIAQRRKIEVQDVEAVEEIFAELAGGDARAQVDVGGGDDPDVERTLVGRADPPDLALLEDAVELDLHRQRQIGDLIEEDRAALGLLEQAPTIRDRRR
jgi:hypothetical protein